MNWIGYTLILSFLPIIISFMLEAIFKYDFALSNLENLYIAACVLSVVVHRDSCEIAHPISRAIQYVMIFGCILSTAIFTALCVVQGENKSLSPQETKLLFVIAFALLGPIAATGILTQIYTGRRSFRSHGKESQGGVKLGDKLGDCL